METPSQPYTPSFHLPTFFDSTNLGTLFGNTGELLKFVMPILLLVLAIRFSGHFIQVLKGAIRSFVGMMGSSSSSSSSSRGYKQEKEKDYEQYKDDYKESKPKYKTSSRWY